MILPCLSKPNKEALEGLAHMAMKKSQSAIEEAIHWQNQGKYYYLTKLQAIVFILRSIFFKSFLCPIHAKRMRAQCSKKSKNRCCSDGHRAGCTFLPPESTRSVAKSLKRLFFGAVLEVVMTVMGFAGVGFWGSLYHPPNNNQERNCRASKIGRSRKRKF